MALFEDIDNILFGGARRRDKRTEEAHRLKVDNLNAKLKSSGIQNKLGQLKLEQAQTGGQDLTESAVKLGKIGKARDSFLGDSPERDAFFDAAEKSIIDKTGFARPEAETGVENERALDAFFSEGLKTLEKENIGRAGKGEAKEFARKFRQEAKSLGVADESAKKIFGELYDIELDKSGFFTDDVLPSKKVVDLRELFGGDEFNELDGAGVTAKTTKTGKAPAKDLSEFIQVGTETVPEDTIPKQLAQLGITSPADQQTFQELEALLPKVDLRSVAAENPKGVIQILDALTKGKTPNGKPFTKKDAVNLMGRLGAN